MQKVYLFPVFALPGLLLLGLLGILSDAPVETDIVLADGPGGLQLVSAPATLPLTVGHVVYVSVTVEGYYRPISVSAQTLIHTYTNDTTPVDPGDSPPFAVGTLAAVNSELALQTLRLRPHPLTLTFAADGQEVSVMLTLSPTVQPHTPVFGTHPDTPTFDGLSQPFTRTWGPNCAPCPTTPGDPSGTTRDIICAKQLNDSCRCHPVQERVNPAADARVREHAPQWQRYVLQFVRSIGGWSVPQHAPDRYLWDGLDWLFYTVSPQERDYSPLSSGVMDGNFGWMTCPTYTNPNGSVGFFDPANTFLVQQYAANVYTMTARYRPDLRFIELSNEPAAEFYLCPCTAPGGHCTATVGPDQPACMNGPNFPEFVEAYGDLLFTAAISASEVMTAANPDALLVTGALDMPPNHFGLSLTTMNLITRGILAHGNVAIGIHQYPCLFPAWISPTLNCSYYQMPGEPYWLPPGCETAPPFAGYTTSAGKPVTARAAWQQFDERVDLSLLWHDAETLGVLEHLYFFDTELHAGFHDVYGGAPHTTTTPAREALAGLRIGAINSHQRVLGSEYIFAPADPTPYNLLVKHLAGVTPVYRWDAPLMDADYSGLVYKLFSRGQEDVIAFWSNHTTTLSLRLWPGAAQFKQVTLTRFADAGGPLAITVTNLSAPPAAITVQPLAEFYFLSVIGNEPGFGWLNDLTVTPVCRISLPLVLREKLQ